MAKSRAPNGALRRFLEESILTYEGVDCLTWPFGKALNGYGLMRHDDRTQYVHRLACERVHGPAPTPKHEAAHSCGNRACVNPHHLSWKTRVGNQADRLLHGTHNRGERQGSHKLTEADVHRIRHLEGRLSQTNIADRFGIAPSTVNNIHSGKRWGWLPATELAHAALSGRA